MPIITRTDLVELPKLLSDSIASFYPIGWGTFRTANRYRLCCKHKFEAAKPIAISLAIGRILRMRWTNCAGHMLKTVSTEVHWY